MNHKYSPDFNELGAANDDYYYATYIRNYRKVHNRLFWNTIYPLVNWKWFWKTVKEEARRITKPEDRPLERELILVSSRDD
ncbi:hypothetical protein [Succinimonas sp.]|uniref:hypothetical protein n=1 Tax=Succinimonas sp. TaxID=1936151 RepID=UPI003863BA56